MHKCVYVHTRTHAHWGTFISRCEEGEEEQNKKQVYEQEGGLETASSTKGQEMTADIENKLKVC